MHGYPLEDVRCGRLFSESFKVRDKMHGFSVAMYMPSLLMVVIIVDHKNVSIFFFVTNVNYIKLSLHHEVDEFKQCF